MHSASCHHSTNLAPDFRCFWGFLTDLFWYPPASQRSHRPVDRRLRAFFQIYRQILPASARPSVLTESCECADYVELGRHVVVQRGASNGGSISHTATVNRKSLLLQVGFGWMKRFSSRGDGVSGEFEGRGSFDDRFGSGFFKARDMSNGTSPPRNSQRSFVSFCV